MAHDPAPGDQWQRGRWHRLHDARYPLPYLIVYRQNEHILIEYVIVLYTGINTSIFKDWCACSFLGLVSAPPCRDPSSWPGSRPGVDIFLHYSTSTFYHFFEGVLHIVVGQCASLLEVNAFVVGKLASVCRFDLLLGPLVYFVADQIDDYVGVRLLSDGLDPPLHVLERFLFGNIVHDQRPKCFPVMAKFMSQVRGRDRTVLLLAGGIPNLHLYFLVVRQRDDLGTEFHSDSGWDARGLALRVVRLSVSFVVRLPFIGFVK